MTRKYAPLRLRALAAPLLLSLAGCSTAAVLAPSVHDSGIADSDGTAPADAAPDAPGLGPIDLDAGVKVSCKYQDPRTATQTDPVNLCFQKSVLVALVNGAALLDGGVASAWTAVADGSVVAASAPDAAVHDFHSDIAVASSIANYLASAAKYGDTSVTASMQVALEQLGVAIAAELAQGAWSSSEIGGEAYFWLRNIASGLRLLPDAKTAAVAAASIQIDAAADAYGQALFTTYYHTVTLPEDAGADGSPGDADVGDGAAGAVDATVPDAGNPSDASADGAHDAAVDANAGYGIFGVALDGGGYLYAPADVVTASYVLLDMTSRYAATTSNAANVNAWQMAAASALHYVFTRSLEPTTGLLYQSLQTSSGATDTPVPVGSYPNDTLLSETQARASYALLLANELVQSVAPPALASYSFSPVTQNVPFQHYVAQLMAGVSRAGMWDGADGGPATGFNEGYVPSLALALTDKPTGANARMYGVLRHAYGEAILGYPAGMWSQGSLITNSAPPNSSLFSVFPGQKAYLQAVSATFGLAAGYTLDGGVSVVPYNPGYYSTLATSAVLDSLNDGWWVATH